jgi:hypothetical protein
MVEFAIDLQTLNANKLTADTAVTSIARALSRSDFVFVFPIGSELAVSI